MTVTDPVSITEIAYRLGVNPKTVSQWRWRDLLPRPVWKAGNVPVWEWATIEEWARQTGRA